MLTAEEAGWLDDYHARVATTLAPLVDGETGGWLSSATRPLARD
jgi:Xaa-Pro aminopeptidase